MPEIFAHPFASFAWKALIAAYEREIPFEYRMLDPDHPENAARIKLLSPTGQMPALIDGDREVTGSNAVIEYLDQQASDRPLLIPAEPAAALEARMMADVFDDYVSAPMQQIVGNALRPMDARDPQAVSSAQAMFDQSYAWLDRRVANRVWSAGEAFTFADCAAAPALFYADWVYPIPVHCAALRALRARLLARPSVSRVVDAARPFRPYFPLGAPDRD